MELPDHGVVPVGGEEHGHQALGAEGDMLLVAGRIGTYERLTMRARRLPKVTRGCLDLAGKTTRCG